MSRTVRGNSSAARETKLFTQNRRARRNRRAAAARILQAGL